jgi:hypothetical protein
MDVLGEVDQDAGEFAKQLGWQTERVVGEVVLRLGNRPPEPPHDLEKIRIPLALAALGAMRRIIRHDVPFP